MGVLFGSLSSADCGYYRKKRAAEARGGVLYEQQRVRGR